MELKSSLVSQCKQNNGLPKIEPAHIAIEKIKQYFISLFVDAISHASQKGKNHALLVDKNMFVSSPPLSIPHLVREWCFLFGDAE